MEGDAAQWGLEIGRAATWSTVDALCRAKGLPELGGEAVATGELLLRRVVAEARTRMDRLAWAAQQASGLSLDEVSARLAGREDGATQLYAALDRLLTAPGRDRATLLGAVLGESAVAEDLDQLDALDALLAVALSLEPAHARVLAVLERRAQAVDPRHPGLTRAQIAHEVPGLEPVLSGVLARVVADGTAIGHAWSPGMTIGGSTPVNEWTLSDLGARVVEYLRLYSPKDADLS